MDALKATVGRLWRGRSLEEPVLCSPSGQQPKRFSAWALGHSGLLEGALQVFLLSVSAFFRKERCFFLWHLTKRSWQSCQMCHCSGRPPCRGLSSERWPGSAGPGRGGLVAESSQRKSFDSGTCLLWQTPCACLDTMRVQDTWLLFGFPGGKALLFIWLNFGGEGEGRERERASGCIDLCLV